MQKQTIYQQLQPEGRITITNMGQQGIGAWQLVALSKEHRPLLLASLDVTPTPRTTRVLAKRICERAPIVAIYVRGNGRRTGKVRAAASMLG